MQVFAPLADYLVVNVSSPNTVGLRRLQGREALEGLLANLQQERRSQETRLGKKVPVLVKLAPDLSDDELEDAIRAIQDNRMDGVIAANTSLSREGLHGSQAGEAGGLSGALPIIGVGGIMDVADVRANLDAGATLVQVYTGLVYRGPGLVKEIVCGLSTG